MLAPEGEAPGLYLHIPFCRAICPYCDFAVKVAKPPARAQFTGRLLKEIDLAAADAMFWGVFDTIYFGGGTPSALCPEQLSALVARLRERLPIDPDAHLYLEANPEDVTDTTLRAWRSLGIRTLSLGLQSLNDDELAFLHRRHRAVDAVACVEAARAAGIEVVSADLIYGLPGQTTAAWRRTLHQVARLAVDHLSCYQLTVHDGTYFGRRRRQGRLSELPDTEQAALFDLTHRTLADLGYQGYEVSNFARTAHHRSRHNQKYWHHVPYLGLGPSAHSFLGNRRWWSHRDLQRWSAAIDRGECPAAGDESLSRSELALEAVMLGFRTTDGVDFRAIRRRFGLDLLERNRKALSALQAHGWIETDGEVARPTVEGLAVADTLARSVAIP